MGRVFSQQINALIRSVYEAAFEQSPWLSFLTQLQTLWEADVASLLVELDANYQRKHLIRHVLISAPCTEHTMQQWITFDPLSAMSVNEACIVDCCHLKTEDTPLNDSAWFFALNLGQIIGINFPLTSNITIKIRLARKIGKAKFADNDRQLLASFRMHFHLAAKFLDRITTKQIERNAFADAMNQLMLGVLILDVNGRIVASNRVARDMLGDFSELTISNGALRLSNQKHNTALYQVLKNINHKHDTKHHTLTIQSTPSCPIGLRIRPVRPEDAIANPLLSHAVVFLSDINQTQDISAQTLQDLFGFTSREVKVAIHLANGFSIDETAQKLCISKNTAKSHVKSIYEKTGVKKQIKLIQMIARSVASVSG